MLERGSHMPSCGPGGSRSPAHLQAPGWPSPWSIVRMHCSPAGGRNRHLCPCYPQTTLSRPDTLVAHLVALQK